MASLVLIQHVGILGGYGNYLDLGLLSKNQTNIGEIGVLGFFCLSGYLISSSFVNSKSILKFSLNRILRIFPGFWVCLVITGFIISPLIYSELNGSLSGFLFTGKGSALDYVLSNFSTHINIWTPNGVIEKAKYSISIDGALWSLFPEIICYGFTIILGYFGLFKNKKLFLVLYVFMYSIFAMNTLKQGCYGPTFIVLLWSTFKRAYIAYLSGILFYLFEEDFRAEFKELIFAIIFAFTLFKFGGFNLIAPILMTFIFINLFSKFEFHLKYDISYGLYIYHFPIGHLLSSYFSDKSLPPLVFLILLFITTIPIAFLSFILVEKPFMNLKKYYPSKFFF